MASSYHDYRENNIHDCVLKLIQTSLPDEHGCLSLGDRMGRLLVMFYLCWKGVLHKPLLYLSYYFKKNRQEYYDRLRLQPHALTRR